MLPSARPAPRAVRGAIGTGATAAAQPPPPVPPPCTAAELARVMSGVTFDTSNETPDMTRASSAAVHGGGTGGGG